MGDSAFERFQRPDNVDVADTPFAQQRGLLDVLLNRQQGPQVVDPASLKRDPWVFNGGGTAKKASDLAWDEATTSPAQRQAQRILGSEPLQTVMNWANFAGPGMGRIPKPVMAAEGKSGIRAYHGSPHDFEKFDISKIGTGEGAQAYGHGLYFAENESVAKMYRDKLSPKTAPEAEAMDLAESHGRSWGDMGTYERQSYIDEAVKQGLGSDKPVNGRLYEVNINADPQSLLDWERVLDPAMREKFAQLLPKRASYFRDPNSAPNGQSAYEELTGGIYRNQSKATEALREAGIPGIRYKDQMSRGAEGGTHNLVVFDDKLVEIIKKYGLAGLLAGGAVASGQQDAQAGHE